MAAGIQSHADYASAMRVPGYHDLDLHGSRVLLRLDLNVPMRHGCVLDSFRIEQASHVVASLSRSGADVTVACHLGNPNQADVTAATLGTVRRLLEEMVGRVDMLPNLRSDPREVRNEPSFVAELTSGFDVFVTDAFSVLHRHHASVVGVPDLLPSAAGPLVEREVRGLSELVNPREPFVVIVGGAKSKDKIDFLQRLAGRASTIVVGGLTALPFLAAAGHSTGGLVPDDEDVARAATIMDRTRLVLPDDFVVRRLDGNVSTVRTLPGDASTLDIGPRSVSRAAKAIQQAQTVFWNGPMGVFETPQGRRSSEALVRALTDSRAITVAGGGHTLAAITAAGGGSGLHHLTTGGGAALAFVTDGDLPGLAALRRSRTKYADRYRPSLAL